MNSQDTKTQKVAVENKQQNKSLNKKKVFVGLSGGVDSAVSAALLKNEGFDVSGVFIKAWSPEGYPCTWREDRRSAMRVAAVLDIPFYTLDLEKEYKEEVADYMIDEYRRGRTPNPDVMCNKEIKFGHFLKWSLEKGANFVATGHYSISAPRKSCMHKYLGGANDILQTKDKKINEVYLKEGKDQNKDQSYFLWTLTQEQLEHILFPIGHLEKSEVRKLAEKFDLPQAARKDSQGICFLGDIDMKEFLKDYIEEKEGNVLNTKGEIIGRHSGVLFYTLGERRGFNILEKTPGDKPLYVVAKDINKNTITVSEKDNDSEEFYNTKELNLDSVSWNLNKKELEKFVNERLTCRLRYRGTKIPCAILETKDQIKVVFKEKQGGVSSGQSVVFYSGDICLGGGVVV